MRRLSAVLAFLAGFIDTAVFVFMGGLFVAHVTGNFVLIGAAIGAERAAGHGDTVALQLVSFPVFFSAAFLTSLMACRLAWANRAESLLWVFVGLTLAVAAGVATEALSASLACLLLVAGMGLLNAAQRIDARLNPPFTVMTGNVTAVAIAVGKRFAGVGSPAPGADDSPQKAPKAAAIDKPTLLIIAFAIGSAGGAVAQEYLRLTSVALPTLLLLAVLVTQFRFLKPPTTH